MKNRKKRGVA